MKQYDLTTHTEKRILFSGKYTDFRECLEHAISKNTDLSNINLRERNLSNGNFDGAYMPSAQFSGANLSGTNLSECCLHGSSFHHASLHNTCLCYSDLRACDFRDADFGATDISGADIGFSRFSTLSCFDLAFTDAQNMLGCAFESPEGHFCKMSRHPIVLRGILSTPIVIMDQTVKIGPNILSRETYEPLALPQKTEKDSLPGY